MTIPVVVAGATGKVGREICRALVREQDFRLAGVISRSGGRRLAEVLGSDYAEVAAAESLEALLDQGVRPQVLVDFSVAQAARETLPVAISRGIAPVVGTTGLSRMEQEEMAGLCRDAGIGAAFVANFAIGAVLMMRFAEEARRFLPHVEIIELHHHTKLDAPSGTALRTKARLETVRGDLEGPEVVVHSVRLPGLVAHQEVIFGGPGQVLTIRHDATSRESYVPGVLLACRWVLEKRQVAFDMDIIAR